MDIKGHINNSTLKVTVKPNAPKTEVIGWDETKKSLKVAVAAVPDKDKANIELLKFLKRQTGKRCEIKVGAKSRDKIISFL